VTDENAALRDFASCQRSAPWCVHESAQEGYEFISSSGIAASLMAASIDSLPELPKYTRRGTHRGLIWLTSLQLHHVFVVEIGADMWMNSAAAVEWLHNTRMEWRLRRPQCQREIQKPVAVDVVTTAPSRA